MPLTNKKILLGISGGIAAYKSLFLIRLLVKAGASVKVIATTSALEFVTKVSIETLSKNKLYDSLFADQNDYSTEHVALTDWADFFILAPATGNIIGKMASGIADDPLSTSLMAFNKGILIAPAMNSKMFDNFAVQKNMKYLNEQSNISFIEAKIGELACGYDGKGRMAEPEDIYRYAEYLIISEDKEKDLISKKVIVTASRTVEALDPVRYLSNNSSGKMGFKIANEFSLRGAEVTLITGPSDEVCYDNITRIDIVAAEDMYNGVKKHFLDEQADILIMSAAVADYTFEYSENKIKKKENETNKNLFSKIYKTKDILFEVSKEKSDNQVVVGFAMETENIIDNARKKLKSKKLDFIVVNSISKTNPAFKSDNNIVTIIDNFNRIQEFPSKTKTEISQIIADKVSKNLK